MTSSSTRACRVMLPAVLPLSHPRPLQILHIANFATSSLLRRPPQPTIPLRETAAEPAVVKAPSQPPNPVSWPGYQKQNPAAPSQDIWLDGSRGRGRSSHSNASADSLAIPHAESSKAAQEREALQKAQQSVQPTSQASSTATTPKSSLPQEGSCASLSPSSPAAPRSQIPTVPTKTTETASPKAVPPEESSKALRAEASTSSSLAPQPAPSGKTFRAKKAAMTLTSTAVERLQELLQSESGPRLIRIGVRNKGCAGMSYHLEYVTPDQAGKFDERVKQDGVEVLIDSKALFSIIGSEMDWKEDKLSAKFVFNNPNVKESCGCGESFLT